VNEAAARNVGRMWANAYSMMPGAVMVRADSPIQRPEDLAGREIAVGYRSGSHYTTVQALEPFLKNDDIKLKFGGMPWARVDAGLDGDVPALTVWGVAYYVCEQLGMRKIVDASFMGGFMVPPLTPTEDIEKYFRALKRAQLDIDVAAEKYKHHYAREIPPRYRDRVDVRRFGPGERVVFLPYSRETFETTQRWIHERDMFEEAPSCDYNAAVVN
jgi:ABC-type nitrate/sulfonate/bicarbonate transport system substrate-binding protein